MAKTFKPDSREGVLDAVRGALENSSPLSVIGHGSKSLIGAPQPDMDVLDLSALSGVLFYEPEELVLSAKSGTPLAEIERLLAGKGQQFAFEPMDYGPLLGIEPGKGTLGGTLAANLSGPRRLKAGSARDHILGIEAVSGRGDVFKSGGRVMKNVTGYDLSKGMAGSWGTLAVLTQVTFKVLPAAETEQTLVLRGLDDAAAAQAMALAMGSNAEVASAAHLPENVAPRVLGGALRGNAATLIRLEGFPASVAYRIQTLTRLFGGKGDVLEDPQSRLLWREIRDCVPFADGSQRPVWRISVAPMQGHVLVDAFRRHAAADAFYDWQGGLVWLRMEGEPEAGPLRALIASLGGGHATLVRASPAQRASLPVFQPQPPALAALSVRLKAQFDPSGILNPGRLGIDLQGEPS